MGVERSLAMQLSYLTLFLLTILIYFMWMDVALYINLQQVPPSRPNVKPIQTNITDYNYSPFYPLTVKLLYQGPTIHYIDTPLAFWTVAYTKVTLLFSANAISILGVIFACAAARMFLSDSLKVRQLGVLMFKIRDYLDSLDGCVARARRNQVALTVEPGTVGFYFDGICDGLADLMVFISLGLFIYKNHASQINGMLNKTVGGNFSYMRLDSKPAPASASGESLLPLNVRNLANLSLVKRLLPSAFLILCIGMQTVLSSALWNYSLITFSNILETDTLTGDSVEKMIVQNDILKASTHWMIIYFWRLLNPHNVMQFILLSILYNRMFEYVASIQYLGFLPIGFTGLLSYVYSKYAIAAIASA